MYKLYDVLSKSSKPKIPELTFVQDKVNNLDKYMKLVQSPVKTTPFYLPSHHKSLWPNGEQNEQYWNGIAINKLSCTGKLQMRDICKYMGCTKAITNDWDIRPSIAVKALSANISRMAKQIHMIELVLESAHQSVSNNIWCVSKQ